MASKRYKVLVKSFINNAIAEEGAIIEFDGEPSDNLELIVAKRGKQFDGSDSIDSTETLV